MVKQRVIVNAEMALHRTELCLTAKMKLLPDKKARSILMKTMRAYRNACNHVSGYAFRFKKTSPISLHRRYYSEVRKKFGLPSQMAQSVFRTVAGAYKAMETKSEWTKPAKFRYPLANWIFGRDCKLRGGDISLKTIAGRVNIPVVMKGMEQYFDGSWKMGTARIKVYRAAWFLEVPVRRKVSTLPADGMACVVGVDMGLNFLATTFDSDGKTQFYDGRAVKHKRQQFQSRRKELGGKKTIGAKRRLRAMGNREYRWMQDVNHRIAKSLVESYPAGTAFVLEDLSGLAPKLQQQHGKSYYALATWSYADLRQKIEYKALKHGSRVIMVDPKYTSQTCPICGFRSKGNRNRSRHEFKCGSCGYTTNDDRAAAMNIYHLGVTMLRSLRAGHAS